MVIKIYSAITMGIDSQVTPIEIDLEWNEQFSLHILGFSERLGSSTRKRIQVALRNAGFDLPDARITVNLGISLNDVKKDNTGSFDLPIALGILIACKKLRLSKEYIDNTIFIGELSLEGGLKPIRGILSNVIEAKRSGKKRIVMPILNLPESRLIPDIDIIGAKSLNHIVDNSKVTINLPIETKVDLDVLPRDYKVDFSEVKGQYQAKRALQIAAAGRHHILFMGPPGSGKTMLASRLPTIMPPMSYQETLESTRIYSTMNACNSLILKRPFRAPHHSVTGPALIGGGINPQPGEISLAHNGILFLDEFTEFSSIQIEALRQPLESATVNIARRTSSITFPAFFLLVAAFNPCPCGYLGDTKHSCQCGKFSVNNYLNKISGPILDRIDLQVSLQSVEYESIRSDSNEMTSAQLYKAVEIAITKQRERFNTEATWNANMSVTEITRYCVNKLSVDAEALLKKAFTTLNLSMRGYHKILKIARTIADLEASETIEIGHLKEALTYRSLDQTLTKIRI